MSSLAFSLFQLITLCISIKINNVTKKKEEIFRAKHFPAFLIKAVLHKDLSFALQQLNISKSLSIQVS